MLYAFAHHENLMAVSQIETDKKNYDTDEIHYKIYAVNFVNYLHKE